MIQVREFGFMIASAILFVVVAVMVMVNEAKNPSGIARPACERTRGTWVKTGESCQAGHKNCRDLHACRYAITDRIREMP